MQNMKVPNVMVLLVLLAQLNTLTAVQNNSHGISIENDKKKDDKNDEEKEILNRIKQDIDAIVDKVNNEQDEAEDEGQEDERHRIIKDHIDAIIDTQRDEERRNEVKKDDNGDGATNNKRYEEIDQLNEKLVEKDFEEKIVKNLETFVDDELNEDDDAKEEEHDVFDNKEKRSPIFWGRRRRNIVRTLTRLGKVVVGIVSPRTSCPGDSGCPAATKLANGCGGKGMSTNLLWQQGVKCACDKHDVCYTCWERYGWTKSYCDVRFYYDQMSLCKKKYSNRHSRGACQRLAITQYVVVRKLGHKFFAKKGQLSKKPECYQSCVKNYGSPFKTL